jgi:hypothetical protein
MITIRRPAHARWRQLGATLPLAVTLAMALASPASAGAPPSGAEFERITTNIRAAVARHDARSYHLFRRQLESLVDEAIGS